MDANVVENTGGKASWGVPSLKRRLVFSSLFGAFIALTSWGMILWFGIDRLQKTFGAPTVPLVACGLAAVLVLSMGAAYGALSNLPRFLAWADRFNPLPRLSIAFGKKGVLVCTALILVCWLPWIIFQYPAAMNADTYNQLYQFQTSAPTFYSTAEAYFDVEYIDHHPVFDTLVFGSFLWLGDLVGSQNAGLFLYSILQAALTAVALAASCCYLQRLDVPKVIRLLLLAFCAFFAPISLFACTMLKDSLFSALFVLFMIMLIDAFRSNGDALCSRRFLIGLILVTGLCILTKKSGVFVVVPSVLALLITCRGRWKQVLTCTIVPVVLFSVLFPAVVYPAIGGVAPGGSQEFMGALYQQVITVLREDGNDVSAQEHEAIDGVLRTTAALRAYDPNLIDPVKKRARQDTTLQQKMDFLGAWAAIGLRHPGEYCASLARVCAPLFAPGKVLVCFLTPAQEDSWVERHYSTQNSEGLHLDFAKPSPLEEAASALDGFWREAGLNPLVALLFGRGLYGGWIPMACLLIACCYKRRNWVVFVPVLLNFGILLISPASSTRYILPLLYCLPLLVGLMLSSAAPGRSPDCPDAATAPSVANSCKGTPA